MVFRNTLLMFTAAAILLSGCAYPRHDTDAERLSGRQAAAAEPGGTNTADQAGGMAGAGGTNAADQAGGMAEPDGTNAADEAEDTVEYNGIIKKRSELSEDTLRWLDWYHSLPEEQQDALNFIPTEFTLGHMPNGLYATLETDSEVPPYLDSLTEDELMETSELARYYFTELSPQLDGVEQVLPAEDTCPMYQNIGIENEYTPGNIIIYLVETTKDKNEGNPMRFISIARRSKSDQWKVINSGF